ncbi:hypothetical protein L6164_037671 [Bauhinia variegata]|uniref:Uncharacterized protein n=1 Tax=Bauhinia variegata TaxID=167791 RepID=A0ACB9KKW4_BAUVA|nr:hypothetical protein L6164_037671 [Bauhinia variegata]
MEIKWSLKRRLGRNQKKTSNSVVADSITKVNGGGIVSCKEEAGVVRMKIVVRKSDLKQLIQAMSSGNVKPFCVTVKGNRHNAWCPALQTIPEEL